MRLLSFIIGIICILLCTIILLQSIFLGAIIVTSIVGVIFTVFGAVTSLVNLHFQIPKSSQKNPSPKPVPLMVKGNISRRVAVATLAGGIVGIAVGSGIILLTQRLSFLRNPSGSTATPTAPLANAGTWTGDQLIGQSSSNAPALAVLNNTLYMAFVAANSSNSLLLASSKR